MWPENWQATELFLALQTQWRVVIGMAGARYQGLDFGSVESLLRMMKIDDTAAMLDQLMVMESAALEELNS